jgi:hypothetical protein
MEFTYKSFAVVAYPETSLIGGQPQEWVASVTDKLGFLYKTRPCVSKDAAIIIARAWIDSKIQPS